MIGTKYIGNLGERIAKRFLKKQKYKIIEQNIHLSHKELDIVAINKKQKTIVFVEVKARSVENDLYSRFGSPASAVTRQKQLRTIQAARAYIAKNTKLQKFQPRFDVVEVYLHKEDLKILKINHIENAFGV